MPEQIREVRALWGTAFNKAFTAASAAGWHPATAHKLAVTSVDLTKLIMKGIPSKVRQSRFSGHPSPIIGPTRSELALGMYLGKGSATTSPPLEATIASLVFGGLQSPPTAKVDAAESTTTTTSIKASAHGALPGMAVLCGVPGDARGNGEVRRIASVTTDIVVLEMATMAALEAADPIVFSHTVYLLPTATQNYIDLLCLGYHLEDQIQALGCMGPLSFSGLGVGEVPEMILNLVVPDWQEVPAAARDQLEPYHAPEGEADAPAGRSVGGFFMGDWGVTTRAVVESDDWSIDPGIAFNDIKDRSGLNGIGGFTHVPAVAKAGLKVYIDEDYGLHADWSSKTAKQLLWQLGNTAANCVAFTMPRAIMPNKPVRVSIGDMAGLKLDFEAQEPTVADVADGLYSSSFAIHWF